MPPLGCFWPLIFAATGDKTRLRHFPGLMLQEQGFWFILCYHPLYMSMSPFLFVAWESENIPFPFRFCHHFVMAIRIIKQSLTESHWLKGNENYHVTQPPSFRESAWQPRSCSVKSVRLKGIRSCCTNSCCTRCTQRPVGMSLHVISFLRWLNSTWFSTADWLKAHRICLASLDTSPMYEEVGPLDSPIPISIL